MTTWLYSTVHSQCSNVRTDEARRAPATERSHCEATGYWKGGQPGASCEATISACCVWSQWSAAAHKLAGEHEAIAKTFQSAE